MLLLQKFTFSLLMNKTPKLFHRSTFSDQWVAQKFVTFSYLCSLWREFLCPSCVPSRVPVHLQSPHWWGEVISRKGLGSMQALLSNNKNTPALSAQSPARTQNITTYYFLWRKLTISQPKLAHHSRILVWQIKTYFL